MADFAKDVYVFFFSGFVLDLLTLTVHCALAFPTEAVIVTFPGAIAVTIPSLTVATLSSDVFQVTVPEAVAFSVSVFPGVSVIAVFESVIESADACKSYKYLFRFSSLFAPLSRYPY